ncbi:MAG: hypothetical protein J1E98_12290 [Lachnospiraceae bacterium]|nr:hypothetical protein [Lachnospiraceae bacterium]
METENQLENKLETPSEDQALELITDIAQEEKEKEREREREQKKAEERARKRKLIPPFIMLLSGAIVYIAMLLWHYPFKDMLVVLLCVLIVFYIAGEIYKWTLDRFEAQIEQARMDEGEVIEKEPDESEENVEDMAIQTGNLNEDNA